MSIEFIRDEFLEGKKEELDKIDETLSRKVKKVDRKVIFLRRFTLALMGQYKIKKEHLQRKHDEIDMLNRRIIHEARQIHEFRRPIQGMMPAPPMSIPTPTGLSVPMPMKKVLQAPHPMETAEEKKEVNVPNPL
jgi:hypothetical protein